jgi:hypothetical protein
VAGAQRARSLGEITEGRHQILLILFQNLLRPSGSSLFSTFIWPSPSLTWARTQPRPFLLPRPWYGTGQWQGVLPLFHPQHCKFNNKTLGEGHPSCQQTLGASWSIF